MFLFQTLSIMKVLSITSIFVFLLCSCAQTQTKNLKIPAGNPKAVANEAVATFAQGCFWHSEIVFQSLAGVRDAVSGYSGGTTKNPSYDMVCTGKTGHAESVQVYYDPTKISYKELVAAFFASMDPTTLNRQGNDVGTEYRSVAFYRNDAEKKIIEAEISRINNSKQYASKVVTEVVPFTQFYEAEEYHQEYILNHPDNPYVNNVSIPDYLHFKKSFKGNFKP